LSEIILYPIATEKAHQLIYEGKVLFCVDKKACKPEIKREIERLYNLKVAKVNTLIKPDGRKIAYVKLEEPGDALKLGTILGLF